MKTVIVLSLATTVALCPSITWAAPSDPSDPSDPGGASPGAAPTDEDQAGRGRIAVVARFGRRVGEGATAISPANGGGVAGTIDFQYLHLGKRFVAAAGVDFGYDRFATSEQGMVVVDGMVQTFGSTRVVSETTFVAVHTVAGRFGRLRPYLTLGAGIGLGYFDSVSAAFAPGTARGTHLLGRAGVGIDVTVSALWYLNLRADYTALPGTSSFHTTDGRTLPLFVDLVDLGVGFAYRF